MEYTRVTVIGSRRKADVVMPDDEPVGQLLPEILDILDEPARGGAKILLTTLAGIRIDATRTLDDQDVGAGTLLRVVSVEEAPQPPEVVEVTEAVGAEVASHPDRWGVRHRRIALSVLSAAAGAFAVHAGATAGASPWWLAAAIAIAVVASAAVSRKGSADGGIALGAAAAGAGVPLAFALVAAAGWRDAWTAPALAVGVAWLAIAGVRGVGRSDRGALAGAGIAIAVIAGASGASLAGVPTMSIAAVVGVVAAAVLGFLPAVALSVSGITAFDDRVIEGEQVLRRPVSEAIAAAFGALGWTAVAAAVPVSAAASTLAVSDDGWALGLAAAIVLLVSIRSRLFPLGAQRLLVLGTALLPAATWAWTTPVLATDAKALLGLIVLVVLLAIASVRRPAVVDARLRRLAEVAETVAVLALVPLLLGVLGVYADLLEVFGG